MFLLGVGLVEKTETLFQFTVNRLKRMLLASAGLLLFAFGYYMQLRISIGGSPWHTLNQGLSQTVGITFGQASILVSVAVVAADLIMREPIGIGTILDAFLVGWGADFFLWLDPFPYQEGFVPSLVMLFASIVIVCFSQVIYMKAGLSCGPRDAMMVALGKRVRRVSMGVVNVVLSVVVFTVGYLLGGTVGLGTLINMFGTGIILDIVFRICRFEPRDVNQEGLAQTVQAFLRAVRK